MGMTERYTPSQIEAALRNNMGLRTYAARSLGCSYPTIKRYIDLYPELQEAEQQIKEQAVDLAESKLLQAVNQGNLTATIFFLKTQGKQRGYTERAELSNPDGSGIFEGFFRSVEAANDPQALPAGSEEALESEAADGDE